MDDQDAVIEIGNPIVGDAGGGVKFGFLAGINGK